MARLDSQLSRVSQLTSSFIRGVSGSTPISSPVLFLRRQILTPLACERVQSDDLYETEFLLLLSSRVSLQLYRMERWFRMALFSVYGSVMVVIEG